jgi:uncharacterized protein YbjT (DUF2867 family)
MGMDLGTGRGHTALVVGAAGFIGAHVVASLRRRGWRVVRAVRQPGHDPHERQCDLLGMQRAEAWNDLLQGVDAVVNAAGILHETGSQTFEAVHFSAPLALAQACLAAGIRRFVQISVLGAPADGEFVASKYRFDDALMALPLQSVFLRPSVVYATSGSYGGTSLLRALAGFPGFQVLPGDGSWRIQPVAARDLGELAANALEITACGIYEVGGPQTMTLREYQDRWRRWLRIPGRGVWRVPQTWVSLGVAVGETLGRGPMGRTMWRMLRQGNTALPGAWQRLRDDFGYAPAALDAVLAARPSQTQDRWHAQLYFLAPALRVAFVVLWLLSAAVGWTMSADDIARGVAGTFLQDAGPVALARASATLDALLALWLATRWKPRWAVGLMMLSVLAYTAAFGVLLPASWLEPLGGLAKNLALLPALAVLWVLVERR